MDDIRHLRERLGETARCWTTAQLEQLDCDLDAVVAILLEIHRTRRSASSRATIHKDPLETGQKQR